jgi:hypothetical protein
MDRPSHGTTLAILACVATASLYIAACACPAVALPNRYQPEKTRVLRGIEALAYGYGAFMMESQAANDGGPGNRGQSARDLALLTWLANPVSWVGMALLLTRWAPVAVVCGAISLALGVYYLLNPPFEVLLPGAYLWVASFAALTIGAVAMWLARRRPAVAAPVRSEGP